MLRGRREASSALSITGSIPEEFTLTFVMMLALFEHAAKDFTTDAVNEDEGETGKRIQGGKRISDGQLGRERSESH